MKTTPIDLLLNAPELDRNVLRNFGVAAAQGRMKIAMCAIADRDRAIRLLERVFATDAIWHVGKVTVPGYETALIVAVEINQAGFQKMLAPFGIGTGYQLVKIGTPWAGYPEALTRYLQ